MKNEIRRAIDSNLAGMCMSEQMIQQIRHRTRQEKVTKKWSMSVVVLAAILLMAVTALAVGFIGRTRFWQWEDIGSPRDLAVVEDQVFFTTETALYQWNPSEEKITECASQKQMTKAGIQPVWSSLFVQDGQLKLFGEPGILWRYEAGKWEFERDYQNTPMEEFANRHTTLFEQDGALFVLRYEEQTMKNVLYRLDLTDGSIKPFALDEVTEVCGYRNGTLLAVTMNEEGERLNVVDAQTGQVKQTLTVLHTLALEGLVYDEKTDQIAAMVDGALCRWDGETWQVIRKAVIPGLSHSFCIAQGNYLAANHEGIQMIPLVAEESPAQRTLSIRGYRSTAYNLDHDYQQAHPELTISRQMEAHLCAKEVLEAIQSGDKTDLFHLHVNAHWPALLESGLLMPLSSDKLKTYTENTADLFQNLVWREEQLFALLSDVTVTSWAPTAEDAPQTYFELLRGNQTLAWNMQKWSQEDYITPILKQQIAETGGNFDTPAFRETLEALKQAELTTSAVDASTMFSLGNLYPDRQYTAPLRIDDQNVESYPVRLHLYVLNPNSENKEEAIAYLEYVSAVADAEKQAMLSPHTAHPSLLPYAEKWIAEVRLECEQLIAQGERLPEGEAERRVDEIRNIPGHWEVEEERLKQYTEQIFPKLDLQLHPLLDPHSGGLEKMKEAVTKYLSDEISLDQLVENLNQLAQ